MAEFENIVTVTTELRPSQVVSTIRPAPLYSGGQQQQEAIRHRAAQEEKKRNKKKFYASVNRSIHTTINVSPNCSIERRGNVLVLVGPVGSKEVSLLEWYSPESRLPFVDNGISSVLQGIFAEKSGPLLKLSKELGYFGYTSIGEKFQERQIVLKGGMLSYAVAGQSDYIYSIPLKDCYVELCSKGDPRRKDAFDMNSRGASHFLNDGKDFHGWLSRNCILLHKPEDLSRTNVKEIAASIDEPNIASYLWRYISGNNKGPGKLAFQTRTFYFSSDDAVLLSEWYEAIKKNIELTDLAEHPIRCIRRLVKDVGGDLTGWNVESLLDQLYGYAPTVHAER